MKFPTLSDAPSARRTCLIVALSVGVYSAGCSPGSGAKTYAGTSGTGTSGSGNFNPSMNTGGGTGFVPSSDGATPGTTNTGMCGKYGNLACQIQDCGSQPKTTVTAKVYDPAGKNPLYDVVVYVPNAAVSDITNGATCDTCATPVTGQPIATALTNAQGQFTMQDVPVGSNVPMVIQIGKWRRQITLPEVKACQDNAFDDPTLFRLPRNQSEGHIPKIAIAAGDADRLQCLFTRIGVDTAEFTNPDGNGSINIYNQPTDPDQGGGYDTGAVYPPAVPFWEDIGQMMKYDIVMLACAGVDSATNPTKSNNYITVNAKNTMLQYINSGGRVLGEHYNWSWIRAFSTTDSPPVVYPSPFGDVATWINPISTSSIGTSISTTIDTTLPRGQAMAAWLFAVNASTTLGTLTLTGEVKPTAVDTQPPTPAVAQRRFMSHSRETQAPPCGLITSRSTRRSRQLRINNAVASFTRDFT